MDQDPQPSLVEQEEAHNKHFFHQFQVLLCFSKYVWFQVSIIGFILVFWTSFVKDNNVFFCS
jgi:hypothetical protein